MLLEDRLTYDDFVRLIDEVYDEIFIWDKNKRCIYANNISHRHLGVHPAELLGKTVQECTKNEELWNPTCVEATFREKKPLIQRQKTFLGVDITTISIPIMDDKGRVEYVVQSARQIEEDLFKMLSPQMPADVISDKATDVEIVHKSDIMKRTLEFADKIAQTKASVLILGETGTGKNMLAKYIHSHSPRRNKPFVATNISSLSPTIIESELFGYEKGAFTGAVKEGKKGIFEAANGGTLFLDEIGELSYDLQAKFLHTLQEETIQPVGSNQSIKLDLRIICATNCNLQDMVEAGRFREDLYHRLKVFDIMIPPLRNRRDDIEPLSAYFLNIFNKKYSRDVSISSRAMEMFHKYPWKGNVRELSNVVERGVLTADKNFIEITNLPESFFSVDNIRGTIPSAQFSLDAVMSSYEKKVVREAYRECGSSRKLASYLQISQSKANRLIQKYVKSEE